MDKFKIVTTFQSSITKLRHFENTKCQKWKSEKL